MKKLNILILTLSLALPYTAQAKFTLWGLPDSPERNIILENGNIYQQWYARFCWQLRNPLASYVDKESGINKQPLVFVEQSVMLASQGILGVLETVIGIQLGWTPSVPIALVAVADFSGRIIAPLSTSKMLDYAELTGDQNFSSPRCHAGLIGLDDFIFWAVNTMIDMRDLWTEYAPQLMPAIVSTTQWAVNQENINEEDFAIVIYSLFKEHTEEAIALFPILIESQLDLPDIPDNARNKLLELAQKIRSLEIN